MKDTTIVLDEELEQLLTEHTENIIAHPNRYLQMSEAHRKVLPRDPDDVSLYNPTMPGVSDEYIRSGLHKIFDHFKAHRINQWVFKIVPPPFPVLLKLFNLIEQTTGKKVVQMRGALLYPPGGYVGWHTNSDITGERVYLAYSNQDHCSYFKYVDSSGDIITSWDKKGWKVRVFDISSNPKQPYWHCIESISSYRVSFGFKLST